MMWFGMKNELAIFSRVVVTTFKDFIQKFLQILYGLLDSLWIDQGPSRKPVTDDGAMSTTSDLVELK